MGLVFHSYPNMFHLLLLSRNLTATSHRGGEKQCHRVTHSCSEHMTAQVKQQNAHHREEANQSRGQMVAEEELGHRSYLTRR